MLPDKSQVRVSDTDPDLRSSSFGEIGRLKFRAAFGPGDGTQCNEGGPCPHVIELANGDIRITGSVVPADQLRDSFAGEGESSVDVPRAFFEKYIQSRIKKGGI